MDEIVKPDRTDEDATFESSIRPQRISEYVGQKKVKDNISVFIEAARKRGEALDQVLLYGPPGLGKTTLAYIIANELDSGIHTTSGPAIEKAGDLAAILTNLEEKDVLFVDEIHRLSTVVEETLYPAMEDFKLDVVIGQGPSARSIKLELPHFTLVGATTRIGLLSSPLRNRFGITHHLDFYGREELELIVERSARILNIKVRGGGVREMATRSRGTPRIANRLLRRVRDFAEVLGDGIITDEITATSLERLEVDRYGLDEIDRKLLLTIIDKFGGGPVGLNTLSAAVGEEKDTIEEIYEPYLIQIGFLNRTPRGRTATERAYKHFEKTLQENQISLF